MDGAAESHCSELLQWKVGSWPREIQHEHVCPVVVKEPRTARGPETRSIVGLSWSSGGMLSLRVSAGFCGNTFGFAECAIHQAGEPLLHSHEVSLETRPEQRHRETSTGSTQKALLLYSR